VNAAGLFLYRLVRREANQNETKTHTTGRIRHKGQQREQSVRKTTTPPVIRPQASGEMDNR